ncbi:hypothetical protein CR513_28091, partial [Mucuna pruriens]
MSRVSQLKDFTFVHNWVKKSIFWELPYWFTNLIQHNLDVMHVKKNVFDNILNMIMDIKGKTKDNANTREDMKMICKCPTLELKIENDKYKKPKATYVLNANKKRMVCEWIKQLKFPNGYVSNIACCINSDDGKIYGMKSHDCHKIFPPAFFDVMEHIVMHISYEAKVGGTVQYRWIHLRGVQNKARVEGSISEAYILEDISNFASMYFDPKLQTRCTQVPQNDDGVHDMINKCLSIFKYPCRPIGMGSNRFLIDMKLQIAKTYVLVNVGQVEDQLIQQMSYGPSKCVTSYNGIIVNGYTKESGQNKATMNSGVCVRGNIYGENDLDYYGIIEEILELSYLGSQNKVFLLQCQWFDPINGVNVDERFGLVDVNPKSKLHSYEPFVLAPQAQQVYYTMYPQKRDRVKGEWWAACKVRRKLFIAETINDEHDELNELDANDYYQDDGSLGTHNVIPED